MATIKPNMQPTGTLLSDFQESTFYDLGNMHHALSFVSFYGGRRLSQILI